MPCRMAGERAAGCAPAPGGGSGGGSARGGSALPPRPFICSFPGCDATFNKAWRLDAHLCRHTGEVSRAGPSRDLREQRRGGGGPVRASPSAGGGGRFV